MKRCVPLLLLSACGGAPSHAATAEPGDPIAQLPSGQALFFESNHGTGATFTEFRPDGTYRTVSREHMFVGESDAGRWRQRATGELLLCSEYEYRYISAPPLWIVVGSPERYASLRTMREALHQKLATRDATFVTKDLEAIGVESDDFGAARTPRAAVVRIAEEMDRYTASGDENLFRTWPRTYAGKLYIDHDWTIPRAVMDAEWSYEAHRDFDSQKAGLGLLNIDKATFDASTVHRERFVFFPEMNGCMAAMNGCAAGVRSSSRDAKGSPTFAYEEGGSTLTFTAPSEVDLQRANEATSCQYSLDAENAASLARCPAQARRPERRSRSWGSRRQARASRRRYGLCRVATARRGERSPTM